MERIDYEGAAAYAYNTAIGSGTRNEHVRWLSEHFRRIATAAAEAQREACYDHTLQTLGCVETARVVRTTKLITESEAK